MIGNKGDTDLSEVLEEFFKYKTTTFYTALPCRVVTVHSSLNEQRVDVEPLPLRKLIDGTTLKIPVILNVPLIFPASKKAAFTFPIDVGDSVLCVFSQRSLDSFKGASKISNYEPVDFRRFDIRDGVAIPGLFPFDLAINDPEKRTWTHSTRDAVIVNNIGSGQECEVRLKENGNIEMRTNQDFFAQFNDGTIECNNLTISCSGNFTVDASGNVSITSGGSTSMESGSTYTIDAPTSATITAPTITLAGAVNITGLASLLAGGVITGTVTNNGSNIGSTHKHAEFDGGNGGFTGGPV